MLRAQRTAATMTRSVRITLAVGAVALTAIALVLLLLLSKATSNQAAYEQHYATLVSINAGIAGVLFSVLAWFAFRLWSRLKRGKFGSRLLIKLALIFSVVGLAPGVLIYTVSYQFVARSIESWFDVKVEGALSAGLKLGQTALDELASDLGQKAKTAAALLGDSSDAALPSAIDRLREQLGASDVVVWSGSGQVVAASGTVRYALVPERPSASDFRAARTARLHTSLDGLDDAPSAGSNAPPSAARPARVIALAVMPAAGIGLGTEQRYLQVVQLLPRNLVANALQVQEANREYQERALARRGLQRMYLGTLTLSLFLSVFGAVLLAILLGNQLVRPLLLLAEGVRQVAEGDLTPKDALLTRDELGGLTRSFADMTQQLADAREQVQQSVREINRTRERLQTIVDNQSAAVLVLTAEGRLEMSNPAATRVMRAPLAAFAGEPLSAIPRLAAFAALVQEQFAQFEADRTHHGADHWQAAANYDEQGNDAQAHTQNAVHWIARGASLGKRQRLVVVDDISEVVSGERVRAWGEVARRLAHEIKNPLTPIQLSAERIAIKLSPKLEATDQQLLSKSVATIVDQVDAMKRLVNEFRDYARLPQAELKPLNLNELVGDVLQLYAAGMHAQLQSELHPECPVVMGDAQQLRQVLHNLVQNAQDACDTVPHAAGVITVRTTCSADGTRVRLTVSDNGPGFPAAILKRAFEPYVTTKTKGTGLGLAVVKKIADEHGARIEVSNRLENEHIIGAQVSLSFKVANTQQAAPKALA